MPRVTNQNKELLTANSFKTLNQRIRVHTAKTNDSLSDFVVRALINQLEREGDYSIRDIMKDEGVNDD